ncbi:MAG: N-acetyltransferase [Planctomycetota bacterium]
MVGGTSAAAQPIAFIRESTDADLPAILDVHREAFGSEDEPRMIEQTHGGHDEVASYVAEVAGRVVGHAQLVVVHLADQSGLRGLLGLGPVGVRPAYQRRGLGSAMLEALIREGRGAGASRLFVLGHPEFYSRFGWTPAAPLGFRCAWTDGPPFMVLDLKPSKEVDPGEVRWPDAFYDG